MAGIGQIARAIQPIPMAGRKKLPSHQKRSKRLVAYCKQSVFEKLEQAAEARQLELGEYFEELAELDIGRLSVPQNK